jgi:hypothetical protein
MCPIYIHDGASAKFSTNSQETAYSVMFFKHSFHLSCTTSAELHQRWSITQIITNIITHKQNRSSQYQA